MGQTIDRTGSRDYRKRPFRVMVGALVLAFVSTLIGLWFSHTEHAKISRELDHVGAARYLIGSSRELEASASELAALEGIDKRDILRLTFESRLKFWIPAESVFRRTLSAVAPAGRGAGSEIQRAHVRLTQPLDDLRAEVTQLLRSPEGEAPPRARLNTVAAKSGDLLARFEGLIPLHEDHIEFSRARARRVQLGASGAAALLLLIGCGVALGARRTDSKPAPRAVPITSHGRGANRAPETQLGAWSALALEGIVTATGDGTITTVNPAAARMFGIAAAELVGKPVTLLEAHAPGTETEGILAAFLREGGDELTGELRVLRRGGTLFPAATSIVRVRREGTEFLLLVLREISERDRTLGELEADAAHLRQLNRELEARARALEESGKRVSELETQVLHGRKLEAVGRLAGGIAHDFNNILSVLLCSNNRLRSVLATSTVPAEQVEEPLEEIHRACWRAATLTRQLLAFSRRQVLHPQVLSPVVLLEGLEGMLRSALTEDIVFRISTEPGIPNIKADPVHLEQVLVNLVLNARDAQGGAVRSAWRRTS